ncbi:hypothetical protein GCK32_000831 [Trichostrongylus colubriformis]|uniref:Uncharacterized protein n=1 Tax=Trichostrongylus colubriformis TaxID=6319 RepID=A0AAN8FV03_TRICO
MKKSPASLSPAPTLDSLMKLLLKASCIFFLVILLLLISFGNFDGAKDKRDSKQPRSLRIKNPKTKVDTAIGRYVAAVGHCLRLKTHIGNAQPTRESFEVLWRALPTVSDKCSVNAQISLRSYPTSDTYNIYFIQNMNTTLAEMTCTVVSLENARNVGAEERLLADNAKCRLLAIDDKRAHNESERVRHLPLSLLTTRSEGVPSGGDGIVNLIGNRVGDIIDLLVIGSQGDSYDYAKMVLTESNKVILCQVNLLYHEPKDSNISRFFELIHTLTEDERYLLMRADRDRYSTKMQLFFVNHREQYCLERYLRMYSFD